MSFIPLEGERQCTRCLQCKPVSDFRWNKRRKMARSVCIVCDRAESLKRYHRNKGSRGSQLWLPTDEEVAIIVEHYPMGGTSAVMARIPGKSRGQIQHVAHRRGIRYAGPTVSGGNTKHVEPNWEIPTHEYCEADIALRQWRAASPVVGTFGPGVGLVVGAAA